MEFYGMSSSTAMQKHVGKVAEYRASEGKTVRVPFKGPVRDTVLDILGGLRSACTYVGADKLKDLPKVSSHKHIITSTLHTTACHRISTSLSSLSSICPSLIHFDRSQRTTFIRVSQQTNDVFGSATS